MISTIRITTVLGCAGLAPFAGAFLATVFEVELPLEPEKFFVSYSAVILSFLCGALWGSLLGGGVTKTEFTKKTMALFVMSNAVSLTAWVSLLNYERHFELSLGLLVLGYTVVLALEYAVVELLYKQVYRGYLLLRSWLTISVVVLHLGMLVCS